MAVEVAHEIACAARLRMRLVSQYQRVRLLLWEARGSYLPKIIVSRFRSREVSATSTTAQATTDTPART